MHKKDSQSVTKNYTVLFFFNLGMFNVLAIINKIRGFMGNTYLNKYFNYFFQFFMTFLVKSCLPHISIFNLLYLSEQLPTLDFTLDISTQCIQWLGKSKVLYSLTQISLTGTKRKCGPVPSKLIL